MTILTPELVEKATAAANAIYGDDDINVEEIEAALRAILSDVIEACANLVDEGCDAPNFTCLRGDVLRALAQECLAPGVKE